jgi:predicted RNA polymerase sigma factor
LQTAEALDWAEVAVLYTQVVGLTGSSVVELNRAVAVAGAGSPKAALKSSSGCHSMTTSICTRRAANCCVGWTVQDEASSAHERAPDLCTSGSSGMSLASTRARRIASAAKSTLRAK